MKIIDYQDSQPIFVARQKRFSELATAALVFIFPAIVLFVLSL